MTFVPPLAAVRCTTLIPIAVPLGGQVSGWTTFVDGVTDRDALRLECTP